MERNNYPSLQSRPSFVYLDASNGFPLHQDIIRQAADLMGRYAGMPGKGLYSDAAAVSAIVEEARQKVARLICADAADIYFISSASEAAKIIAEVWCVNDPEAVTAYSPEDHTATLRALEHIPPERLRKLQYSDTGTLHGNTKDATVFLLSQMHHIYGTDIATWDFKTSHPQAKLAIDASQSISRMEVNVAKLQADALYFSGHKLGALPGAGILYVAPEHKAKFKLEDGSGSSLPWISIASIGTSIDILLQKTMAARNLYLTQLTNYLVDRLEEIPDISFSKGMASALDICAGNGLVSFKIRGFSATDIMLLCDEHEIALRGGDHCVSPEYADQDFVRVSMQAYTTEKDIDRLVEVLMRL